MRFEQTRAILQQQVAPYHRAISQHYQHFAGEEISPRNRLLLEYLIENELRLALAIHDFLESVPSTTLDYWFKRIEVPFPHALASTLSDPCRTDLDALVGAAIHYRTELIAFYAHLLLNCDSTETAHLFQKLKDQEEQGMKRFIRHAQGLADL